MSQKIYSNLDIKGTTTIGSIANATTDTDKFLVSDGGLVKYRTGAEMLSDLGVDVGAPAARLQHVVKAAVAINKGQAIYISGADGTNMLASLASNTSEATSSKTMGLLDATVAINGFANVVSEGLLAGLNTIGATAGDPVWLGTGGNLIYGLINKPYAPTHLVFIGIVTRVNLNSGEIFVKVQNGFELDELHDVDLKTTTPINGHILGFNGTLWVNKTIAGWLGYTPANANGTTNYLSKFTGSTTLGNSLVYDNGTNVLIGTTTDPNYAKLVVSGGNIIIDNNAQFLSKRADGLVLSVFKVNTAHQLEFNPTYGQSLSGYLFSINGSQKMTLSSGGSLTATADMRAPIFYDSDNTNYYLDPAASSNLYDITANKFVKAGGTASQFLKADGTVDSNTYLTSVTNISGYSGTLISEDNRTISPSELAANRLKFGFTSWNNNNSGPYADFLHMRSYQDASGGLDNLVMFRKDAIGMRIWQQTYGSATAYSSYKDISFTDGTNATGTWPISITGSATSAGSVDFNNLTNKTLGTGTYQTSGDFRAPIFYDSDNTGYYVNPAFISRFDTVLGTSIQVQSISPALVIQDTDSSGAAQVGYISYRNTSGAETAWEGFGSALDTDFSIRNTLGRVLLNGTYSEAVGDFRAPIFYDSDNTGYYVNPASTSNTNLFTVNQLLFPSTNFNPATAPRNTEPMSVKMWDNYFNGTGLGDDYGTVLEYYSKIGHVASQVYFDSTGGSWYRTASYAAGWQGWQRYITDVNIGNYAAAANHTHTFDSLTSKTGGTGTYQTSGDFRAPIVYDSNNTAYYLNPDGGSNLNTGNLAGRFTYSDYLVSNNSGGLMGDYNINGTNDKVIWTIGESWPLANMYGLGYSYGNGYGHHLVIKNNGSVYHRISFASEGAFFTGIVTASGSSRAPIFYDTDNTGYYIDAASTSNLNALNLAGDLSFGSQTSTWITSDVMADSIGWNSSYGVYIGSNTLGYSSYIRGNGTFTNNTGTHNLLHADNYTTYTDPRLYRGYSTSGDFQTLQSTAGTVRFDQIGDTGSWSNPPGGYNYGGMLSLRGTNFGFQLWGSHTGNFYFKTQWDNDQYSGWREVIHSANIGSFAATTSHTHTFDSLTSKSSGTSTYQTSGDFRAPIFYDSDNTAYYTNPNGTSSLSLLIADNTIKSRKAQADNDYTTAAIWTESYSTTTTGIAFHISGTVGKFLEMRTNGVLYWDNSIVWHAGNDGSGSGLDADLLDGNHASAFALASHTHPYDNYQYWNLKTNGVQRTTITSNGSLDLVAGTNVSLSYGAGGVVTISSTDTNTVYTHPAYTARNIDTSGAQVIDVFTSDAIGSVTNITTRTMTLADLGYTGATNANFYVLPFTDNSTNWNTAYSWGNHASAGYATAATNRWYDGWVTNPGYDANTIAGSKSGFTYANNAPYSGPLAHIEAGGYGLQFNAPYSSGGYGITFRTRNGDAGTWNPWQYPAVYGVNVNGGGALYALIYYDTNNTAYYLDPASTSNLLGLTVTNTITGNISGNAATATSADQIDGMPFRNTGSNSAINADTLESNGITYYTAGVPNFTGNATDGALYSQAYSSAWQHQIAGDFRSGQIAIRGKNSGTWQAWRTVLDSSNVGTYAAAVSHTHTFDSLTSKTGGTGTYQTSGDFRAPVFYDSNNTGFYIDPNLTSNISKLYHSDNIVATNFGYGQVGLYSSIRYQAVFSMGEAYILPADGTSIGNLYGMAWSHPNAGGVAGNLNTHGLLVTENGSFLAAISGSIRSRDDMRAPIFYDSNNTGYFIDPTSTSNLVGLTVANTISGNITGNAGSASAVAWTNVSSKPDWMTTNSLIASHNNANDWRNSGFYENDGGGSNWPSSTWYNSINVRHSNQSNYHGFQMAMSYYDNNLWFRSYNGAGSFQAWETAIGSGGSNQSKTGFFQSNDSLRAPIFYDSNNTAYYINPADSTTAANLASKVVVQSGSDTIGLQFANSYGNPSVGVYYGSVYTTSSFYAGSPAGTAQDVLGNGARFNIFYERTNTAYYIDPASTSVLNRLSISFNDATYQSGITITNTNTGAQAIAGVNMFSGAYSGSINMFSSGYMDILNNNTTNGAIQFRPRTALSFHIDNVSSTSRITIGSSNTASHPLRVTQQVSNVSIYADYDIVAYSDQSVKENIRPIENVLERINNSRGVLYDRIDSGEKNNIGFIAQELEVEFPELVVTNEDNTKAVKYQNAVAVLFEAVKEQQKQIEELKELVNKLITK
jgi:hypothetical protein